MNIKQRFEVPFEYSIEFTEGVFEPENTLLSDFIAGEKGPSQVKVGVIIDQSVAQNHPTLISKIDDYFKAIPGVSLSHEPVVITGGEEAKNNLNTFKEVLDVIDQGKIDRHSYLIGIGGGAVLDMVGFAAAIGHRGIRHIRIPTTVLSQNDSGVGVKNGINFFGKKNFLGAFTPPVLVINDFHFLTTLSDRDWRSGMSEAVKVALIKDKTFFNWLEENAEKLAHRDLEAMKVLVFECARLHADHIVGNNDPFESGSSRPLDFGHWAAHKMEQLTQFEIKHGEAVAIGIAFDIYYGGLAEIMSSDSSERVINVLHKLGFDTYHPVLLNETQSAINPELIKGLEEFREHLGGELTITMVPEIGTKIDVHQMDIDLLNQAALNLKKTIRNHVAAEA
ncbi:3-dehydroquinate synthase [Jiulongibacter sediminis]|uniref:3-dehydroquinate synthase n=1 Tax=Jiulongibacter sediminis TaxID=1605367 RepID=A0A0P7C564_9BACT|nr:3-dehydroquinate synthase [Jiulongibacter sediminis]KPM48400.1 3-dehydroquinate synthase [Jiulongibacter sediminis]TBX24940.1 3-dehydroquinate synthase [Jiulongibacter sediminis]